MSEILAANTTDVLGAAPTDVLSADATDVMSATQHMSSSLSSSFVVGSINTHRADAKRPRAAEGGAVVVDAADAAAIDGKNDDNDDKDDNEDDMYCV